MSGGSQQRGRRQGSDALGEWLARTLAGYKSSRASVRISKFLRWSSARECAANRERLARDFEQLLGATFRDALGRLWTLVSVEPRAQGRLYAVFAREGG